MFHGTLKGIFLVYLLIALPSLVVKCYY